MLKSLFSCILIFLSLTTFSQSFSPLNSGTINQLNGIHFISNTKGVAVGNSGTVLTTSNGTNWVARNSGINKNLVDVKFINSTTVIAVGWSGAMIKSTNSGLNWSTVYPGGSYHLNSLYVNGPDLYATGQNGIIIKSTDEGDSWTLVSPGTGNHIFDIFFTSQMTGYAVGNQAYIHKTTDGGASWSTTYSFQSGISENFQLRSVYFTDADNGYIIGKNLVQNESIFLRTTNAGVSWTQQIVYFTSYVEIEFLDGNTGYIISQNENSNSGRIYKTINGGDNWSFLTSIPKSPTDLTFPSLSVGYVCGFSGIIYKSTDIDLGINDLGNEQGLSIYPNPVNDKINISIDSTINTENLCFEIYSVSGEKLISHSNLEAIDVSGIPAGIYFLKVKNETISRMKKFIKE